MTQAEQPHTSIDLEFTVLMALLMSIVAISIDAMLPALGMVTEHFKLENPNAAQYLVGFIFIGMGLGELVCGPVSDALGRKPVLYAGILLYLVGSVICYFAPTFELLLAGRVVQGVAVAAPYVCSVSIVRDRYAGRAMARVMSIVMMIFIMVPAIAPSVGQGILMIADWRAIFVLYIFYAIVITCWIYFRLPETLPKEKRIPFHMGDILSGFGEVVRSRVTMCYILCMSLCFGAFFGYLNCSQQIFQEQFKVGKLFSLYFGGLALVLGVASLLNSKFVEKYGMHFIAIRSFACVVVASAVFLALHKFVHIDLWMFCAYAAILFFCFGLIFGNLNALAMEPMGHIAGIATAVIGFVSSVVSFVLGAVIGQAYDQTLVPMSAGFLVLCAISLALLVYSQKLHPSPATTSA